VFGHSSDAAPRPASNLILNITLQDSYFGELPCGAIVDVAALDVCRNSAAVLRSLLVSGAVGGAVARRLLISCDIGRNRESSRRSFGSLFKTNG
jgi:hypothetical protein